MQELSYKVAKSQFFQNFVTFAIIVAGLLVGISTYHDFYLKHQGLLDTLNLIVLIIFIIEIAVKIAAEGKKPWLYFTKAWNIFDFVIVTAAFLSFGGSSIAILRLLRLLRVLKLIKALPRLQVLVSALLKSIPSMGYVSILLLLLFYIYAVAAVFFFGENDPIHFKDLQTSMLSMFRVVTLEDWTDVMYINMFGCESYGYGGFEEFCTASKSNPLFSALFFVSFVLVGTMIFLNLFIGVIMNGMDEARKEMEESQVTEGGQEHIVLIEKKMEELLVLLAALKKK